MSFVYTWLDYMISIYTVQDRNPSAVLFNKPMISGLPLDLEHFTTIEHPEN